MMSKKLESIINSAIKMANELHHEFLTLEGIFLAMLEDKQVLGVLEDCGPTQMKSEMNYKNF